MQSSGSRARSRGDPYLTAGDQQRKGLTQAWDQLGKARRELRCMEYRLGNPGPAALESSVARAYGSGIIGDSNPGAATTLTATARDTYVVDAHRQPTARFVDASSRPSSSPSRVASGSKRKVSRQQEDKDFTSRPSSSSGTTTTNTNRHPNRSKSPGGGGSKTHPSHHTQHQAWLDEGRASANHLPSSSQHTHLHPSGSPKRVDFSKRLRLREVRWDGTYEDSVTQNCRSAEPLVSSSTYVTSAAAPPHPSSSSLPLPPPSSVSSFSYSTGGEPGLESTLTDSRAIRETGIRFLNDTHVTHPLLLQQDRWLDAQQQQHHHPHHHPQQYKQQHRQNPQQQQRHPRLTHVDVAVVPGSRPSGGLKETAAGRLGHAEGGLECRNRRTQLLPYGVPPPPPVSAGDGGDDDMSSAADSGGGAGGGGDMGDHSSSGGDGEERGAVGGAERASSSRGASNNARQQRIKKSLKDLPPDDNILSKLREKIKQQRLSASSTDTSQNDSLTSSVTASDTSREPTPRHALHHAHDPVWCGGCEEDCDLMMPEKIPRSRKVAAGPPIPSYKGFSETQMDPHLQASVKKVNRLAAPKNSSSRKTGGSGGKGSSSSDPVHNAIQTQLKPHGHPPFAPSSVQPTYTSISTPNGKGGMAGEKPRKVASGSKPSRSGAKNVITTSSWRAGQDVVARELGLTKTRSKEEGRKGTSGNSHEDSWKPDGAEGNMTNSARVPITGADHSGKASTSGAGKGYSAHLAQSRALSEDAKKMFSDLQLDNHHERTSSRPAVKRKAPKERDTAGDQPDPSAEKQRHYDSGTVRQFMARQKMERQRQKEHVRRAEEQQRQKKQQLMQELITKQRSAAATTVPTATSATKTKKVKGEGKGKQTVNWPAEQHMPQNFDQRIRSLLGEELDKEHSGDPQNRVMETGEEDDNSDAETLTGESEGSTPRATPHTHFREDAPGRPPAALDPSSEHNNANDLQLPLSTHPAGATGSLPTSHYTTAAPSGGSDSRPIEFQGRTLNLDRNTVLTRFSQVCHQRQDQGVIGGGCQGGTSGAGGCGGLLTARERTRQDRLQDLKVASKSLETRIASAAAKIHQADVNHSNPVSSSAETSEVEFVPRYDRIAGSSSNFHVFTASSNLPGVGNAHTAAIASAAAAAATAGRMKSSSTGEQTPLAGARTTSQRDSMMATAPRSSPMTPAAGFHQMLDDDDSVTETSTFTVTPDIDDWEADVPKQKASEGLGRSAAQRADGRSEVTAQYSTPTTGSKLRWEDPHSDPYSVLNIFSRQQGYAVRAPEGSGGRGWREPPSQAGSLRLKDPTLMASQQVTVGRTPEGHPLKMTSTYTRLEGTLPLDASQASQHSASARHRASRSEDRSERVNQSSYPSRVQSMSEDTQSMESEEEGDTHKAASSRLMSGKKSGASSFRRQMSDTGQETDVSQLSEDEPRVSVRSYNRPMVGASQQEVGEARWSPAALERQMAAELARLESLEDSIRQLSSAERTRAVALAQQETVSVAQVLKARQQEHSAELRSLQLQVQEERLASAQQLQQQLVHSKGVQAPASDMSSLLSIHQHAARPADNRQLLEKAENRRPDAKVTTTSLARSQGRDDTEYSETFMSVRDTAKVSATQTASRSSVSPPLSAISRNSPSIKTADDSSTSVKTAIDSSASLKTAADDSAASVKTAEDYSTSVKTAEDSNESIKTAEDSQVDSEDSSIKTASDSERPRGAGAGAVPEDVPDGDYSLSFEESVTEDESSSHRRNTKHRKTAKPPQSERSSVRVDLTSVYGGEDSFNRFTVDIVRNIMREEEMRAQYQESLLRIRAKALREKTRAQLSLLRQERQQWEEKGQGGGGQQVKDQAHRELRRLADKERVILKEQEQHKAEINRMFKTEQLAREHRQSLLKQHKQIAKMQEETQEKMHQLQGRLGQPAEVHTEDDTSMVEDLSDASDISYAKDSKSDMEVTQRKAKVKGDKQKMEKQQKLRLDQKYLTVREQKLLERKKQASELLRWKQDLDAEEAKVLQLERTALKAWQGRVDDDRKPSPSASPTKSPAADKRGKETEKKVKAAGNLRPETAARAEDNNAATTPRTARADTAATTPRSAGESYTLFSQSEAVSTHMSTHISASESENKKSATDSSVTPRSRAAGSRSSEASVAEDIPDGSEIATAMESSPEKRMDSSDDTIINSSVNEEEEVEVPHAGSKGKKSPVETQSDVSDYEARIRQLSDMLGRRRKEADMLKKERSRRMKDKLRAQEESLKKQVEAYEMYIAQVKKEQQDLEHEGSGKPAVPPKIKQPGPNAAAAGARHTRGGSPSSTSPSPSRHRGRGDDTANYSSSFDAGTDSSQISPALSEDSRAVSRPADSQGARKKSSSSIMDRISEGSESPSERTSRQIASTRAGAKTKAPEDEATTATRSLSEASSLSEAIDEALDSGSAHSSPSAILNIKTSQPARADSENEVTREDSGKKATATGGGSVAEDMSYSQDFSEAVSQSLAKSHGRVQASGRDTPKSEVSEAIVSEVIESAVSTAKSDSSASAPKLDLKQAPQAMAGEKEKEGGVVSGAVSAASSRPATGIQESDSESESRHKTVSRPSSERSTGSTTYSDLHDLDQEEEEDIISSESERTPVKGQGQSTSLKEKSSATHGVKTEEEDISEHVSVSLPSISEKQSVSVSQATGLGRQDSMDAIDTVLGDLLGGEEEEEATPTHTPRAQSPPLGQDEAPDALLMTDPLADFHEGDQVVVWGRLPGTLRFKGAVSFAPGHWAGVELSTADGDTDGLHEGRRYFSCPPAHGLLVPGSDIAALEEEKEEAEGKKPATEEAKSPDESLTTEQDEEASSEEEEKTESVSIMEDVVKGDEEEESSRIPAPKEEEEESDRIAGKVESGLESPVREEASAGRGRPNLAVLADDITADLTRSLVEDSMQAINTIATRHSPRENTPPPTLPKPRMGIPAPQEDATAQSTSGSPPEVPASSPELKAPHPLLSRSMMGTGKPSAQKQEEDAAAAVRSPISPKLQAVSSSEPKTPPPTLPKPLSPVKSGSPEHQASMEEKTPPPTLPKPQQPAVAGSPKKTPPPTLPKPQKSPTDKTPPPTLLPKPDQEEKREEEKREEVKVQKATTFMMDGLLNDAIASMMKVRRSRRQTAAEATKETVALVNGGLSDDSGVDPSHDSSLERGPGASPEPTESGGVGEAEEVRRPMCQQRPKSPVPETNSPSQEEEEDEYDFSGLMGDSQDFFDEDFGLSGKPPPPYPGPGIQGRAAGGADSPKPPAKAAPPAEVYIVPHERSEVEAVVSDAVSIFWNLRRCGEPWESAQAPEDFLQEKGGSEGEGGEHMEGMVSASLRTFKTLVFNLTGEIVQEIYRHQNDAEPSVWEKAPPKRQRYYKGSSPPPTQEALLPVVQSAVTDILGLNGCSGRYRGKSTNKWNVRKKKDHVDSVLVEELQEEEADWINYDTDELAVKMQLTETLMEFLLDDTVAALNKVFARKQQHLQHTS